jgi:hypothetical protein
MWGRASHHAPLLPARLPASRRAFRGRRAFHGRRMALPTFPAHREKAHTREATAGVL